MIVPKVARTTAFRIVPSGESSGYSEGLLSDGPISNERLGVNKGPVHTWGGWGLTRALAERTKYALHYTEHLRTRYTTRTPRRI